MVRRYRERYSGRAFLDGHYPEKIAERVRQTRERFGLTHKPDQYQPEQWLGEPQLGCSTCGLDQAAENFGDTPGLPYATALTIRRFGVENFADAANGAFVQLLIEALHKPPGAGPVIRMHL